ncbi:MAG: Nramp family divalent metal transporter [Candidatus Hydrogenedentes bacterium]|nr:Nramp family divalent metal transporter [Candidatus Hydrogenedentota bacterium]
MSGQQESKALRPPPEGFFPSLRYLGPGVILSAAIVGSGELIATTTLGAKAGFAVLWVILLGCVIKVGVQLEFGRHCITHGQTAFFAWNQGRQKFIGLHWTVYAGLIYIAVNILGQGGVLGATALVMRQAFPGVAPALWPWLLAIAVSALVFHGRYGPIEHICMAFNLIFVFAILYCVFAVQQTPYAFTAADIAHGFSLTLPKETLLLAVSAFGITGVGAGEILVYPTWCVEKGYAAWTGPRDDSPEWADRARGWIRVMTLDAVVSLIIYTTATVSFYILGATVLRAQPEIADGNGLIVQLSNIFTSVLGEGALVMFLFCAFAVLFSTAFSNCASNSRLWTDFLTLCGVIDSTSDRVRRRTIGIFACLLPLGWAAFYVLFEKPLLLVTIMGVANSVFLLVVVWQAFVYRYYETDPRLRPSRLYDAYLWASLISLFAAGAIALRDTLFK